MVLIAAFCFANCWRSSGGNVTLLVLVFGAFVMACLASSVAAPAASDTPSMTQKMAVFASEPITSMSTATAVKPGFFSSWRKANLRSFITQRLHRIDLRRTPRRQPAGEQSHPKQQNGDAREREQVRKESLREHFADEHDLRVVAHLRRSEPAPLQKWDAHGAKIIVVDVAHIRMRVLPG